MVRTLIAVKLKCQNVSCGHSKYVGASTLYDRLGDEPTLINIGQLAAKFKCSLCNSKDYLIFDDHDVLIFDTARLYICHGSSCNEAAIPIPRLNALPQENLCAICKEHSEKEANMINDFPEVPKDKRSCPRCLEKHKKDTPVVVYQNRKNKTFFIGCSLFPKCRWAEDL